MQIIAMGRTWTRIDADTFATETGAEVSRQDVADERRTITWANREIAKWAPAALAGDQDAAACYNDAMEQLEGAMWGVELHAALWG